MSLAHAAPTRTERDKQVRAILEARRDKYAAAYWEIRRSAGWRLRDDKIASREARNDFSTGIPHSLRNNRPRCPCCGRDRTLVISGTGRGKRYRCEDCSQRFTAYYLDFLSYDQVFNLRHGVGGA
jgi:hypothetical protein